MSREVVQQFSVQEGLNFLNEHYSSTFMSVEIAKAVQVLTADLQKELEDQIISFRRG